MVLLLLLLFFVPVVEDFVRYFFVLKCIVVVPVPVADRWQQLKIKGPNHERGHGDFVKRRSHIISNCVGAAHEHYDTDRKQKNPFSKQEQPNF